MKATIHLNRAPHQLEWGAAMQAGLERHGIAVSHAGYDDPQRSDFAVIWGAPAKHPRIASTAPHVLVMERGHLPNRLVYTSCGWDGLGRRGRYSSASDGGARWRALFGHLMEPWRVRDGYALIIGQVEGDAALGVLDLGAWVREQTAALQLVGWEVRFRPHPLTRRVRTSLADDLADAGVCVTYNSTAGVEAVLAGVPTVTMDEGAMAWDVTGHTLEEMPTPDRESWAHDLAWTSYTREEISSGLAWERLAPVMEEAPCPVA